MPFFIFKIDKTANRWCYTTDLMQLLGKEVR